jgi:hypothetical protein
MAATKFGVIVSTGNAIILRYVYPTADSELNSFPLGSGEMLIQVTNGPFANSAAWATAVSCAVNSALGKPPGNAKCSVINSNGNVVNVIMADATLAAGLFPGMTLVNSSIGSLGWTWTSSGGFLSPSSTGAGLHG